MVTIALISGSLRAESANTAALRAATEYFHGADRADGREPVSVIQAAIDDLPLYSEDVEEVGWPHPVQRLRDIVAGADALVVATPEYNGSMSGVLKNALDWLSRPYGDGILQGRLAATISASPSAYGAKWAQDHLRHVLETCQVTLINSEAVTLTNVFDALDAQGEIADPVALAAIRRLAAHVVARAHQGVAVA
jgi:chromate reductase